MPCMPRVKGKAAKIAYSILGMPANLRDGEKKHQSNADRVISYQNTQKIKQA